MTDKYPETIEIELNREALRKYLRYEWLRGWVIALLSVGGFIGVLLVLPAYFARHTYNGAQELILDLMLGFGVGLAICLVMAALGYVFFIHRRATKMVDGIRAAVEGSFLRVVTGGKTRIDRKLHFRAIVDYNIVDDKRMRRFGITSLVMTTTGGGVISIGGVTDGEKTRDMLAEIDSIREVG